MHRWHDRKSPRIPGYDYRQPGLYFVTVCAAGRACVFGEVCGDRMVLSPIGRVARDEWARTLALRPTLAADVFVVMPNHVHLLVGIPAGAAPEDGPGAGRSPGRSVPAIVGGYKAAVTRRARAAGLWGDGPLWQARFHDRVVRDDAEAGRVRRYVVENPARWAADRFHPGPEGRARPG